MCVCVCYMLRPGMYGAMLDCELDTSRSIIYADCCAVRLGARLGLGDDAARRGSGCTDEPTAERSFLSSMK